MNERTDRNWRNAVMAIIGLAVINIFLVGAGVTLYQSNHRQDAQLAAAEARLAAGDDLRESEQKAAVERAKVACALSWNASDIANSTISNIRKTVVDLSRAATNPDVVSALQADAELFSPFPEPACKRPFNPSSGKNNGSNGAVP